MTLFFRSTTLFVIFMVQSVCIDCALIYVFLILLFRDEYWYKKRSFKWRNSLAQWVAHLTRNVGVMSSSPIKALRCFLEQETLPLLLSTGWFQEQIRAWFHNQTKMRALWKIANMLGKCFLKVPMAMKCLCKCMYL